MTSDRRADLVGPGAALRWIRIEGGLCRFGDTGCPIRVETLEWTQTVLTPAQLELEADAQPLTGISQPRAATFAERLGGRLPRSAEWEWAAGGPKRRTYPWGEDPPTPRHANLRGGPGRTTPVGSMTLGSTPEGLMDMAGNVWEWTSSPVLGNAYVLRGASFNSPALYAKTTFLNAAPAELESPGIGFRVVREP